MSEIMGLSENIKMETSAFEVQTSFISSQISAIDRYDLIEDLGFKEIIPIIPCYNGKSLKINEGLVVNGLSAISIKHPRGYCSEVFSVEEQSLSETAAEERKEMKEEYRNSQPILNKNDLFKYNRKGMPECLKGSIKNRNSFWNVHRPELSKLTWPQNFVSSAVMQDFFHHHLQNHGTFCEPLHDSTNQSSEANEEIQNYSKLREIVPPRILPPDEKVINIMEKSRSVQLNDEDLDPEIMISKMRIPSTCKMETLQVQQHEGLLTKQSLVNDERIPLTISNTNAVLDEDPPVNKTRTVLSRSRISLHSLQTSRNEMPVNNSRGENQITEDSGDPARLRTILSPRDNSTQPSESRHNPEA